MKLDENKTLYTEDGCLGYWDGEKREQKSKFVIIIWPTHPHGSREVLYLAGLIRFQAYCKDTKDVIAAQTRGHGTYFDFCKQHGYIPGRYLSLDTDVR